MDLAVRILCVNEQHLPVLEGLADGDDHAPARLELLKQRLRHERGRAGDDNDVEPTFDFRPAEIAVADLTVHVGVAQRLEDLVHGFAQRFDNLDRIGFFDDAGE